MKNRVKAWLLEAPAIILLVVALIASIYLAASKQYGVGWGAVIIFLIIVGLFFWGKYFENKQDY
jgi:nitrogen fixation-related uncharacterized protein